MKNVTLFPGFRMVTGDGRLISTRPVNVDDLVQRFSNWDKSKSRVGQWDMGHIPEAKYSEHHRKYMNDEIDYKTFIEEYRNPKNYRPESPSANRGHKYE